MEDTNWLDPWMNELLVHTDEMPILELGCGKGVDTFQLTSKGFQVVSLDVDHESLKHCVDIERCFPINADISAKLPFSDHAFAVVLASLSLHYFSWQDTLSIVNEIRRVLRAGGVLLLRVNSTADVNFGAGIGEEIERNYFLNEGRKKRFFEKSDVELMLQGMHVHELWHATIDRYGKDKNVWVAHATA